LAAHVARAGREEERRTHADAELDRLRAELEKAAGPRPLHPDDLRVLVAALGAAPATGPAD
jgi:hypothetical protein